MVIALRDAPSLAQDLEKDFDLAIGRNCFQKENCALYKGFTDAGKPLLNIEFQSTVCPDTLMPVASKICYSAPASDSVCSAEPTNCFELASLTGPVDVPTAAPTADKIKLPWPFSYFEDKELTLLIIAGLMTLMLLIMITVVLCLCCHSNRRIKEKEAMIEEKDKTIERLQEENKKSKSYWFQSMFGGKRKSKEKSGDRNKGRITVAEPPI
jgi:hypothetical protein